MPPGLGEPVFDRLDADLAYAMMGINAVKGVEIGEVMRAFGVGTILETRNPNFKKGETVEGITGVQYFAIHDGHGLVKVDASFVPLSWYLGILGMPGLTAYFGLLDKGRPMDGETVLVSAAAGMVGSLVGQIAKLKGCKVIGIAGGKEKCDYLKTELGFDAVIDYKNEIIHVTTGKNMQKINICMVKPDNYIHSYAFVELGELIFFSLKCVNTPTATKSVITKIPSTSGWSSKIFFPKINPSSKVTFSQV